MSSTGKTRAVKEAPPALTADTVQAMLNSIQSLTEAVAKLQERQDRMDDEQHSQLVTAINARPTTTVTTDPATAATIPVISTPIYARNPGQLNPDEFIDFKTASGRKTYQAMVAPLNSTFDHTSGEIITVTAQLSRRAKESGWTKGKGQITNIPNAKGEQCDLFQEFGRLTVDDIKAHIRTYQGTNLRAEQNSEALATCIMQSVADNTEAELLSTLHEYEIEGKEYGELIFKALMQKTLIDNQQTTRHLRDQYDQFPQYMMQVESDIPKFILRWRNVVRQLEARGETIDDKFNIL